MKKARQIIINNRYEIKKYEGFKKRAMAEGDTKYATQCQAKIDQLNKGIERWRGTY